MRTAAYGPGPGAARVGRRRGGTDARCRHGHCRHRAVVSVDNAVAVVTECKDCCKRTVSESPMNSLAEIRSVKRCRCTALCRAVNHVKSVKAAASIGRIGPDDPDRRGRSPPRRQGSRPPAARKPDPGRSSRSASDLAELPQPHREQPAAAAGRRCSSSSRSSSRSICTRSRRRGRAARRPICSRRSAIRSSRRRAHVDRPARARDQPPPVARAVIALYRSYKTHATRPARSWRRASTAKRPAGRRPSRTSRRRR